MLRDHMSLVGNTLMDLRRRCNAAWVDVVLVSLIYLGRHLMWRVHCTSYRRWPH